MASFPPVPPILKPCQTYLKLAADHEKINPMLSYWARLYTLQLGLKIDSKQEECRKFLMSIMDWLEKEKKSKINDETYVNEIIAQAQIENYGMKIFLKADGDDRAGNATKNTAKQFFTAAQIFDLCAVFGELSEELSQKSKYSKWRAAYIIKCIKSNEKPLPPEEERSRKNSQSEDQQPFESSSDQKPSNSNDISPPPSEPKFNDFNVDQINNLSIDNKPSQAVSTLKDTTKYDYTPYQITETDTNLDDLTLKAMNGVKLSRDEIMKAQKYAKWASSSLDYDDIKAAVNNLQKALNILIMGKED